MIRGLNEIEIQSYEEFKTLYWNANKNRTTKATQLNERSSRSHAVLQLEVYCNGVGGKIHVSLSTLHIAN